MGQGDWKALRCKLGGPLELHDLAKDLGEAKNIADRHPDVIAPDRSLSANGAQRFDRLALGGGSGQEIGEKVSTHRLDRITPPVFPTWRLAEC
jgi:hypothetical protein